MLMRRVTSVAERIAGVERELYVHTRSHEREHYLATETMRATSEQMNKRLEGMNEFRDQMADQAAMFLPRKEFESSLAGLRRELAAVTKLTYVGLGIVTFFATAAPILVAFVL